MADKDDEVKWTKLKVKHRGRQGVAGPRVIIGKDGVQTMLLPGEEKEVEIPEQQAERMREASKLKEVDLEVDGQEAEDAEQEGDQPTRAEIDEKEEEARKQAEEAEDEGERQRVSPRGRTQSAGPYYPGATEPKAPESGGGGGGSSRSRSSTSAAPRGRQHVKSDE